MIRVCLVDDQTLVRQGIRSLLALDGGIEVVAEAGDGRQAVDLIPQVRPDVVLMDMRMPVMSGLEALQVLSRLEQLPPTIILTTFDSLDRPDPLTDRETEILRLMASGFSNKEIANSLGVAEGTIKNHVSNILSKLGVRDRTRAVLKAFELQLV